MMDLLLVAFIIVYLLKFVRSDRNRERRKQKKKIKINVEKVIEFQKGNRIIGDFVLTEAAMPIPGNTVQPKEGFRIDEWESDEQDGLKRLRAAVSAEHIFDLFTAMIIWLNDAVSLSIVQTDYEEGKIYYYFAYDKDVPVLLSIFSNYRWMIQNNGEVIFTFATESKEVECQLDDTKIFTFYAWNLQPVIDFLAKFGIKEDKKMIFFPERGYITFSSTEYSEQLAKLVQDLNIDETRVIEMEKEEESSGKSGPKK